MNGVGAYVTADVQLSECVARFARWALVLRTEPLDRRLGALASIPDAPSHAYRHRVTNVWLGAGEAFEENCDPAQVGPMRSLTKLAAAPNTLYW